MTVDKARIIFKRLCGRLRMCVKFLDDEQLYESRSSLTHWLNHSRKFCPRISRHGDPMVSHASVVPSKMNLGPLVKTHSEAHRLPVFPHYLNFVLHWLNYIIFPWQRVKFLLVGQSLCSGVINIKYIHRESCHSSQVLLQELQYYK